MNYKNYLKEQLLSELVREDKFYLYGRNLDGTRKKTKFSRIPDKKTNFSHIPDKKTNFGNLLKDTYRLIKNPIEKKPRSISPSTLDFMKKVNKKDNKKYELFKNTDRFNTPSYDYKPNIIH